ncbi:MAG: hypothetical protein U0990_03405 [Candidatus Nanopelagicales bacterium]|nr:hypothetical protein [Candidatus Nanopelagicales bacterium]MDZ4249120.1 hypothetical protein [Candidatus Nanopelagicales bacterium]
MEQLNSTIMRKVALPVAAVGISVSIASGVIAGTSATVAALSGVGVVLVFFTAGQIVLGSVLRTNPTMGLTAAMMLYLIKVGVLLALLILLADATFMNTKAFALAILVCTLAWTCLELWAFSRLKTLYVDPDNPAPGFAVTPPRRGADATRR